MERRVIKFSLVGAIFVLILIIAIIIGIIALVVNLNKDNNKDEEKNENTINQVQQKEFEEIKKREEEEARRQNETLIINGEERKIVPETYKSTLGYEMMYDVESFYPELNETTQVDEFKSLYTDKIYVNISKVENKKIEDLLNEWEARKDLQIKKSTELVNGKECTKIEATNEKKTENINNYYIKYGEDSYYVIETHCGSELTDSMIPLMEKMVLTFKF